MFKMLFGHLYCYSMLLKVISQFIQSITSIITSNFFARYFFIFFYSLGCFAFQCLYNPAWVRYSLLHILHLCFFAVGIVIFSLYDVSKGVADGDIFGKQPCSAESV